MFQQIKAILDQVGDCPVEWSQLYPELREVQIPENFQNDPARYGFRLYESDIVVPVARPGGEFRPKNNTDVIKFMELFGPKTVRDLYQIADQYFPELNRYCRPHTYPRQGDVQNGIRRDARMGLLSVVRNEMVILGPGVGPGLRYKDGNWIIDDPFWTMPEPGENGYEF